MRRPYLLAGAALAVVLALGAYAFRRDGLSITIQSCAIMGRVTGSFFPCSQISSEGQGGAYVVLRVPWSLHHFILIPQAEVRGTEDARLDGALGREIWLAAWRERRYVVNAKDSGVRSDLVGVAVNSKQARSQDRLHLHLDCLKPRVVEALPVLARMPAGQWVSPQLLLEGNPLRVMRVDAQHVDTFNPFEALRSLPDGQQGASIAGLPDQNGGLLLIALIDPARGSEELLDHSCAIGGRR